MLDAPPRCIAEGCSAERNRAKAALERAKEPAAPQIRIDPTLVERLSRTMRANFRSGSIPFRNAYLQSLVNVVEVVDHRILIRGSKDPLEKAAIASPAMLISSCQE